MNTQLQDLYRRAGDAVEPAGDVRDILSRAKRRRAVTQVAAPLATAAVVAGAVGVVASEPWSATGPRADVATGGGSAGYAASLPDAATVAGHTYTLDDAGSHGVPDSATLEITFRRGTYSASAGCNTFQGRYDLHDDVLVATGSGETAGFCPGAAKADAWLGSFLAAGPQVSAEGDRLRLDDGESDVRLSVPQVEDAPLAGTDWRLDSIVNGPVVEGVPKRFSSSVAFDDDGTLSVDAPCGAMTMDVEVADGRIEATGDSASSGESGCDRTQAAVNRRVRNALHDSVGYQIDGNQLQVRSGDGALVYTAN